MYLTTVSHFSSLDQAGRELVGQGQGQWDLCLPPSSMYCPIQDMQEPARHKHTDMFNPVAVPPAQRGEPQTRQARLRLLQSG